MGSGSPALLEAQNDVVEVGLSTERLKPQAQIGQGRFPNVVVAENHGGHDGRIADRYSVAMSSGSGQTGAGAAMVVGAAAA